MTSLSPKTLDAMLEQLAIDTWERSRDAKRLSVRLGEETITDLLMLDLRRQGFKTFRQTSKAYEPTFGTDFECWLGCPGSWIGFAVQDKKLDFRTGRYLALGHYVGGQRQSDILETYAKNRGMIPRYCLYNHADYVDKTYLQCCSRCFREEELGCTLIPLAVVQTAIGSYGGKDFHSLHRLDCTVPWRCLAICPRLQEALASKSLSLDGLTPLLDNDTPIHEELPAELGQLSKAEDLEDVDFEQYGIGVDPAEMGFDDVVLPTEGIPMGRLVIPRRVYILELPRGEIEQYSG